MSSLDTTRWRRPRRRKLRGLGDVVALIAQPIASGIDSIARTHLATCAGCKERRETLNRMIPFSSPSAPPAPRPRDKPADPP